MFVKNCLADQDSCTVMEFKNYIAPSLEVISVSEFCGEISACGGTLMTTRVHCRRGQDDQWCENGYL